MNEWISVEDESPEMSMEVIWFNPMAVRKVYFGSAFCVNTMGATHWMPLPPPPSE